MIIARRYRETVLGGSVRALAVIALVATACAAPTESLGPEERAPVTTTASTAPDPLSQPPSASTPRVSAALRHAPIMATDVPELVEPVPPRMGPLLPRDVVSQAHVPFAVVGEVVLVHPSSSVEAIGFHESNHDGAQQMDPLPTAVAPFTMASRDRGTGSRTAADVVVEPGVPIVSPVTGVVLRAGSYVLYCDHRDHFVVIEPDDRPGWEVKVLHFLDLQVSSGTSVEAGVTVLGSGPRPLAFRSQVDDATAAPSWPHIHIEVVDPSIPDRPSGTSC